MLYGIFKEPYLPTKELQHTFYFDSRVHLPVASVEVCLGVEVSGTHKRCQKDRDGHPFDTIDPQQRRYSRISHI